jgi:hypothetical protein
MLLYHGSSIGNLQTLQPFVADHGKPYVYFSTRETAACFHAANIVERPYYWYPYGYDPSGKVIYTELYPGAFEEAYAGKRGYLYTCDLPGETLLRFPSSPNTRLSSTAVHVTQMEEIEDLYAWFLARERENKLIVQRYDTLAPEARSCWYGKVLEDLRKATGCAGANALSVFVRQKIPAVWTRYEAETNAS